MKLDGLTLDEGSKVTPFGATVTVPPGGLATQDFAVVLAEHEVATVRSAANGHPRGDLSGGGIRVQVTGQVQAGEHVFAQGRSVEVDGAGVYHAWVDVKDGTNRVPLRIDAGGTRSRFYLQQVEVAHRGASVIIVPSPPEPIGLLSVPPSATGQLVVMLEAPEHTRVTLENASVELPASGARVGAAAGAQRREALQVQWITVGGDSIEDRVPLESASGISAAGLLEGELGFDPSTRRFSVAGRGAAAVRGRFLGFDFSGELDLRDEDFGDLQRAGQAAAFFSPRSVDVFERALSPTDAPPQWGDDSATVAQNPAGSRFRLEISREGVGKVGFGSYRAQLGSNSEVGRFYRSLTAAYLEARTPDDAIVHAAVRGFYAPDSIDAVQGLVLQPRHERFEATGGSLFYLSGEAAQGSERIRIELLDGVTGLPVGERHLQRGVDYSIDYLQGRILLAQPLWSFEPSTTLPTASRAQVLWVDYEHPVTGDPAGRTFGGEAKVGAGPVNVTAAYAEQPGTKLLRGNATLTLGRLWATVELARSMGMPELVPLGLSNDGGLTFATAPIITAAMQATDAFAVTARLRTQLYGEGWLDAAFRWRDKGFNDEQHFDLIASRQISARFEQPIGGPLKGLLIGAQFDDRAGADPRVPFSTSFIVQRIIGGVIGYERERWGIRVEARDVDLIDEVGDGGRTSVSLSGRYQVTDWLTLRAGYRQRLVQRGVGAGAFDDTFASAGVDVKPSQNLTLGIRGGWGPVIGPQVWGTVSMTRGDEVMYAGHMLDVDAPAMGEHRVVMGARREVEPGTTVYVEDAAAQDLTSLRMSRAIGISQQLPHGLTVSLRYERGLRQDLDVAPQRLRDAGGGSLSWVGKAARAWLRGEARYERGGTIPSLVQVLGSGGGEAQLRDNLRATLSATYSHTMQGNSMTARLFDGIAALSWRFELGMVVLRYWARNELLPPDRDIPVPQMSHTISLMPSIHVFSRLTIAAGGHLQWLNGAWTVLGSLRPSVRVFYGLELAAEAAVRTRDLDGQGLTALRAEVGYRLADSFLLAVGATIIGYQNIEVAVPSTGQTNRFYVRGEVAY